MNKFLILFVLLFLPNIGAAYNPAVNHTKVPYEPLVIDGRIEEGSEYLGELVGDPHMYEFTIGVDSVLNIKVAQKDSENPILLSLIAVKENTNNAGVAEVGRLPAKGAQLTRIEESVLGMTFLESQFFTATITPGTYRVEVSTPDNVGKYMLLFGTKPSDVGYFKTLADIRLIQKFFGESFLAMFKSSYVKYPLGIILIGLLFYFTWQKRSLIQKRNG